MERPWGGWCQSGIVQNFRQKSQLDGEGTAEGYCQGIVLGVDPTPTGSVWLRNSRGRVVQVEREQLYVVSKAKNFGHLRWQTYEC